MQTKANKSNVLPYATLSYAKIVQAKHITK